MKSGTGGFDPLKGLLDPRAIGEKVTPLTVGDAHLMPDRGKNEEEEEREGQRAGAEGGDIEGHPRA